MNGVLKKALVVIILTKKITIRKFPKAFKQLKYLIGEKLI